MRIVEPAGGPAPAFAAPAWPDHARARMSRDFLLWRHLRVIRARMMRHMHQTAGKLLRTVSPSAPPRPARTSYGVMMWPNWDDRTYAYCHYATYGPYLADLIAGIDQPFCFLDVGANQGLFSLVAARNTACEKIVALEPVPDTHRRLSANLALAELGSRAEALNVGLSNAAGDHLITLNAVHSGQATLGDHLAATNSHCQQITVKLITMAELEAHLPPGLPLFVKIDVEGHEPIIIEELLGSRHAGRILGIFYEHDDRWTDNATIERALYRAGFAQLRRYGRGRHYDVLAAPSPTALTRNPAFESAVPETPQPAAFVPEPAGDIRG
jgi:FkbM family methyltransferase